MRKWLLGAVPLYVRSMQQLRFDSHKHCFPHDIGIDHADVFVAVSGCECFQRQHFLLDTSWLLHNLGQYYFDYE